MLCPNCETPIPEKARFCQECGGVVTAFAPPEGFRIDAKSLRFYRDDGGGPRDGLWKLTWFDPDGGEYEQGQYPASEWPQTKPVGKIPEDFRRDPQSGLYCLVTPGIGPDMTTPGEWITHYNPANRNYTQQFRSSEKRS